jgi:hypothetical protein
MRGSRSAAQRLVIVFMSHWLHYGLDPTCGFANDGFSHGRGSCLGPRLRMELSKLDHFSTRPEAGLRNGLGRVDMPLEIMVLLTNQGRAERKPGNRLPIGQLLGMESCYSRKPSRCCPSHARRPISMQLIAGVGINNVLVVARRHVGSVAPHQHLSSSATRNVILDGYLRLLEDQEKRLTFFLKNNFIRQELTARPDTPIRGTTRRKRPISASKNTLEYPRWPPIFLSR